MFHDNTNFYHGLIMVPMVPISPVWGCIFGASYNLCGCQTLLGYKAGVLVFAFHTVSPRTSY